jgi:lipopolysaccharide transport system ATP-binding protein
MVRRRTDIKAPRIRNELVQRIENADSRQPPDFIIIGTQKGGTTSLHRSLSRHPDVGQSLMGEDHFFSWQYDQGLDWRRYLARFPLRGEVASVGVSSPSYLFHPRTPERVRLALPQVKLIALLRNPVDRAYSQHQMNFRKGIEPLSFEEAIAAEPERLHARSDWSDAGWRASSHVSYLTRGLYAEQLQRWFDHFPREQMLIIKSETFFAQPDDVFAHALRFLDLPAWQPDKFKVSNPGAYEQMQPETRARLMEYFSPHNQRLYALLGDDFAWEVQEKQPSAAVS